MAVRTDVQVEEGGVELGTEEKHEQKGQGKAESKPFEACPWGEIGSQKEAEHRTNGVRGHAERELHDVYVSAQVMQGYGESGQGDAPTHDKCSGKLYVASSRFIAHLDVCLAE